MKKIYSIFLLGLLVMPVCAQDIVKDFFKSNQHKRTELKDSIKVESGSDSIPFIRPNESKDTNPESNGKETKLSLGESLLNSIKSNAFIIRQDYCLYDKKQKKYFGYEDKDQFGISYSLAFKCSGFNLLNDESVKPWAYDEKYGSFESKNLEPVITESYYTSLIDASGYVALDSVLSPKQVIKENFLYASVPFTKSQEGLVINRADTCNAGVVVWFVKESGSIENGDISVSLVESTVKAQMFVPVVVTSPVKDKEVVGAIYMVKTGESENSYMMAGVVKKTSGNWVLSFPFKGFTYNADSKSVPSETKSIGKLTEIKKKTADKPEKESSKKGFSLKIGKKK